MSNSAQLPVDEEFNYLAEIPSNLKIVFTSLLPSWRAIRRRLGAMEGKSDFLLAITLCPLNQWVEIKNRVWRLKPGPHKYRLFYDADSHVGIIKCMPSLGHEVVTGIFEMTLNRMLPANVEPYMTKATLFTNRNNSQKEGDGSWVPDTRDRDEWPSLVLEVGYSQTLQSLRQNARWWLESSPPILASGAVSRGVQQVVIIKIIPPERKIIIESWVCGPNPPMTRNRAGVAIQEQPAITLVTTLDPTTNAYSTTVQGSRTLPILWEALNDGPWGTGQGNYIMGENVLKSIGNRVWRKI